ncbi:MAG: GNAT family N-acetyltransferase [Anaerolineae bacterium]|jgi:N-acetylglutamate synthase-like GNAT family acetyltransferase
MAEVSEASVRRARPADAERIAAFVNRARSRERLLAPEDVRDRFGTVAFLLAQRGGEVVGLLGWRVENLVARVTDFLVWPAAQRVVAGRALLSAMEVAAGELLCEAVILFVARDCPSEVLDFWKAFGYERRKVAELPKAWREASKEVRSVEEQILLKQLRDDLVRRPL